MGYFASDEEEKARRYDYRQKGKATQQHLATLEGELKHFAAAWYDLAQYGRNPESVTFTVTDDQITVQRDTKPITTVFLRYFDAEALRRLLADMDQTKRTLDDISRQCIQMGDPL